jgi:hypothetical protein
VDLAQRAARRIYPEARDLDGKVIEEWQEWNEAAMLRQLGVLPERESTQERALLGVSNLRTRVGGMLGGR